MQGKGDVHIPVSKVRVLLSSEPVEEEAIVARVQLPDVGDNRAIHRDRHKVRVGYGARPGELEDAEVRGNRLELLRRINRLYSARIADLSQIVTGVHT